MHTKSIKESGNQIVVNDDGAEKIGFNEYRFYILFDRLDNCSAKIILTLNGTNYPLSDSIVDSSSEKLKYYYEKSFPESNANTLEYNFTVISGHLYQNLNTVMEF